MAKPSLCRAAKPLLRCRASDVVAGVSAARAAFGPDYCRAMVSRPALQLIAAGYMVVEARVLLVHHNRFARWVPPGGHVEQGETFGEAAEREFEEETGIAAHAISAAAVIHPPDENAQPLPVPFYCDLEHEGFDPPAYAHFFFVEPVGAELAPRAQQSEVRSCRWFTEAELADLESFEQVRSLALHALTHHPAARGR
jgi:8-oxo-dGTP diphosphatase